MHMLNWRSHPAACKRRYGIRVAILPIERKAALATVCALVLSLCTPAAMANYIGDNHTWIVSCNASGYQLKSKYPVSRFVEAGTGSSSTEEVETLYLGKGCDAEHDVLGKGKWCQANGGFTAEFEGGASIGFPRQELRCDGDEAFQTECGC